MTVLAALEVVSVLDMRTPGIGAPDSPLTVPVIEPPATCAWMVHGIARVRSRQSMAATQAVAGLCRNLFFAWFSLKEVKLGSMQFCEARERPRRGRPFPTILPYSGYYLEDVIMPAARSLRTTAPPFITNFTRCISVMSVNGSPATARVSCLWMISALIVVAIRRVNAGLAPHLTKIGNISPCTPCEQLQSVL